MSRGPLRTLFSVLTLVLALATAVPAPGAAAGSRGGGPGRHSRPSLADFVPRWIVSLFEKIGLEVDPNGSEGTVTTNGDGGDVGLHADPNG